jgi:uncharacterized membrane protein
VSAITRRHRLQGVALLVAALLVNPWVIGYVLADDGNIDTGVMFAALLFLSVAGVLGGLQLLVRWVDPLAWTKPVGFAGGALTVAVAAALVSGTHWRLTSYAAGHQHEHTNQVTGHDTTTPEERQWADDFYRRSLDAALRHRWFDYQNALSQGFQVDRVNGSHFPNLTNMFDDVILDPDRPEWLIFNDSPDGKVLTGFMYFTRKLEEVGPTPGGALTQWHYHPYPVPRCAIQGLWTVARTDEQGQCAEGVPVSRTPEMLHVWFVDHPLGRFTEMNFIPARIPNEWFDRSLLHPIVVHFGIALFVVAILLDAAAMAARRPAWHHAAWLNLVLAAGAAIAAVAAGMESEIALNPTHALHATLDVHKTLAYSSLGVILVLAAWRYALRGGFPRRGAALLYAVVSLAGLGVMGGAGYYGGELVYEHGAGVRAIDQFARQRYFDQVREFYRRDPNQIMNGGGGAPAPASAPAVDDSGHAGHH